MDAERAMQSTSKVPPYWARYLEHRGYPFRIWLTDVGIWASSTELAAESQGGAVTQRLGGVARNLERQIHPGVLRNGCAEVGADGQPMWLTGLEVILRGLVRRYSEMEVETSIGAIIDLLTFQRLSGAPVDDMLGRVEIIKARAEELGDFNIGTGGLSCMAVAAAAVQRAEAILAGAALSNGRTTPWRPHGAAGVHDADRDAVTPL